MSNAASERRLIGNRQLQRYKKHEDSNEKRMRIGKQPRRLNRQR